MLFDFKGKTILVTGSTSGIGLDLVKELSNLGANLVITYRDEVKFLDLKKQPNIIITKAVKTDLKNPSNIFEDFTSIKSLNLSIDGFVHCAGIADARPIKMMNINHYNNMFSVNLFSYFEIVRFLLINNLFSNPSSIVSISSIASEFGLKAKVVYSASKGALNSSTRSLAKELSNKGIRVNSVVSGFIKTDIYSNLESSIGFSKLNEGINNNQYLGLGNTKDIINVIIFLLSNNSKFITGTNLVADGGWLS
jgi:NAD(P)-dependent dehydrogenase (short-subunit alcohol dehydrogenase family)